MDELQEQEQSESKDRYAHLKPYQFKPGQSGNPAGRPPGPSLKEWSKTYLMSLTDAERMEFMTGIDKKVVWEMAEGKPETKGELEHKGQTIVVMPSEVANRLNGTPPETEGGNKQS